MVVRAARSGGSLTDHRLDDVPRDGRRDPAAGRRLAVSAAVLDDDGHRDLRVVGRSEGREPRVRRLAVALLCGSGLAGHLDAVDPGRRSERLAGG